MVEQYWKITVTRYTEDNAQSTYPSLLLVVAFVVTYLHIGTQRRATMGHTIICLVCY